MARTANRKPTTTNSIKETSFVALEASADESRIDETNHVIRGVKVIGRTSAHGYEYSPKAVTEAKGAYEGARVYVGHKRETSTRTGSYGERLGVLKNYRVQEGEGFADLHYNPKHPQADQFVFDVKNTPNLLGFSHHADIVVRKNSTGKTVVESIDKVYSVDLVNVPATTKGVFESEGDTMQTLKQMIEAAEPKSLTVLEDMMNGGSMSPDLAVEAPEGSGADAQIKAAFRSAAIAAFDDESLDSKATLAKIKEILAAYDKLTAKAESKPTEPPAEKGATESVDDLRAEVVKLKRRDAVRTLATKENVRLRDVDLAAAVALESEAERVEFVKGLPKIDAKQTGGAPRPDVTTVQESAADVPKEFKSEADRNAWLRS